MTKTQTKQQAHLQYIKERAAELNGNEYIVVVKRDGEELIISSRENAEDLKGLQARQVLYTVEWFPGCDPAEYCGLSSYTDYENEADNTDALNEYRHEVSISNDRTEITYNALQSGEKYQSMGKRAEIVEELTANPSADNRLKLDYYMTLDRMERKASNLRAQSRKAEKAGNIEAAADLEYMAEKAEDKADQLRELYRIAENSRNAEEGRNAEATATEANEEPEPPVLGQSGQVEEMTEEQAAEFFGPLGLADGIYSDLFGLWYYEVSDTEQEAEIVVPLTSGRFLILRRCEDYRRPLFSRYEADGHSLEIYHHKGRTWCPQSGKEMRQSRADFLIFAKTMKAACKTA